MRHGSNEYAGADAEGWYCGDKEYEFLSFETVTRTAYLLDSETSVDHWAVTRFHQDDDHLKGKPHRSQVLAPDGTLMQQTDQTWSSDAGWARLDAVMETTCGSGTCQAIDALGIPE